MAKHRENRSDTLTARLSSRMKAAYEQLAEMEQRTVSHVASEALAEWMREHHPELIPPPAPPADPLDGICRVPLYDVRAAAGGGNFISEENLEKVLELTRRFVADLGTIPENLLGLRVAGDSMEPELLDGDVVLVNTHRDLGVPLTEDVYVFRLGGDLLIKRLKPLPGGGALVVSTNPRYPPFELPVQDDEWDFQIIGRLAVRWREMG